MYVHNIYAYIFLDVQRKHFGSYNGSFLWEQGTGSWKKRLFVISMYTLVLEKLIKCPIE